MVGLPADGSGADLVFTVAGARDGRDDFIVVSITVVPFDPPSRVAAHEVLAAMIRSRAPEKSALVEEFTTPAGCPAVGIRRAATQEIGGRPVTSGQAQALVVYREPGALGVVSGACRHAADLDTTAVLVAGIAARMTVTAAATATPQSAAA
jgi:hypothetical protein